MWVAVQERDRTAWLWAGICCSGFGGCNILNARWALSAVFRCLQQLRHLQRGKPCPCGMDLCRFRTPCNSPHLFSPV